MLAVIVNAIAIILGTVIGLVFKKSIPKKVADAVMLSLGLCVFVVGLDGVFKGTNQLILIVSMVLGTIVGELIDIDHLFAKTGAKIENKFANNNSDNMIAKAFISASLLFCIGSMAITGSLSASMGDYTILFTKSMIDAVSACMLATTLGFGVMISSIPVFIVQGTIVLLAGILSPLLEMCGNDIICCGSVMILAIGLNMMNITKIKVANTLPALIFVPIVSYVMSLI